jgi:hypothetical protein
MSGRTGIFPLKALPLIEIRLGMRVFEDKVMQLKGAHRVAGEDVRQIVDLFLRKLDKEDLDVLLQVFDSLGAWDGEDVIPLRAETALKERIVSRSEGGDF